MTGHEFAEWRRLANFTQLEAACAIGVSRRTVQNWEAAPDTPIPKPVANLINAIKSALAKGPVDNPPLSGRAKSELS